jgi:hypothetical protein
MKCTGWSEPCDSEEATRRRQDTRYVDDERNFVTLCDRCFEECEKHWAEMWEEYYAGCM